MKRMLAFLLIVVVSLGVIGATSPALLDKTRLGLDLKGGFEILYQATPLYEGGTVTKESLNETAKSLEKRVNQTGVSEPEVTTEGADRIRIRIAGMEESKEAELRETLVKPANLTFRSARGCKDGEGYCKIELTGQDFKENGAALQQSALNEYGISIKLKDASKFAEVTREVAKLTNGKNVLAIYLDEEEISAPSVRSEINQSEASITGSFTRDEAMALRDTINLGALPLKLEVKYTQSVGATLGQKSLDDTIFAGVIGTVFIVLFMLIFYRVPGIAASVSLIIYTWLLLAAHIALDATLTLPGIAAFILGVGIAVDANIITAERIKEELRSGKSLNSAFRAGSKTSLRTIIDSHVTTIIASLVLFFIGVGSVKGFAITLLLSVLISLISNVVVSRYLLWLMIKSGRFAKPGYYGVKESEIRAL
ncbi:protein translocase subunit SecD [Paenibacillus pasadenensis]|uniref:Protein translocase subunit SecD n=1 Tax=Paenibacillus pasadenensis TaxID=217090 RepID=A0A2N5N992_9BACL|nr:MULTISPECIES: protein translocase subunit SecD [Paenibacillus]PLT46898.1 Protein-export membrane protein SecD [Paenibacillus pasadenensis]QGG57242.1 protein translocase subunit SecD [Paenibacillus sp. B01]